MENSLSNLADALRERLKIIRDEVSRQDVAQHVAKLRAISERIEALQNALPATADPRLRHFLERRSYDKALEWIETNCTH